MGSLQALKNEPLAISLILAFIGVVISTFSICWQTSLWIYANNQDEFTTAKFTVDSVTSSMGRRTKAYFLNGRIGDEPVSRAFDGLNLPQDIKDLKDSSKRGERQLTVLYARSLKGEYIFNSVDFFVLDSSIEGTTVASAVIQIAAWNSLLILGALLASYFGYRRYSYAAKARSSY